MRIVAVLLWFNVIVFSLYGVAFILFPKELAWMVVAATPTSDAALIDMRATYGGTNLGIGLLIGYLSLSKLTFRHALQAVFLINSVMALARGYGLFLSETQSNVMFIYLGLEIGAALLSYYLLKRHKRDFYHPYY